MTAVRRIAEANVGLRHRGSAKLSKLRAVVVRKAVHPDPARRFEELSEFVLNLRRPDRSFREPKFTPLIERNPLLFWKATSLALAIVILLLLIGRHLR